MTLLDIDKDHYYTRNELKVLNLLQHPVWIFDIQETCMFWANLKALEMWNASSLEELLNRNFKDDLSEATGRRMQDHLLKLKKGEITKEQWTFYPNGGQAKTLGVTGSGIRIEGGRVAALAEAELPNSEEIVQSSVRGVEILRHLPLPVCQFDVDGKKLVYQNPEAFALFASPDGDEETTTTSDDAPSDDAPSDDAAAAATSTTADTTTKATNYAPEESNNHFMSRFVDRALGSAMLKKVADGENYYNAETELYTKRGPRWFSTSVRRAKDPVTSDPILLWSAQDITEIVQARKDRQVAQTKTEFFAIMAHEIRTPLHQIIGNMDLLELTDLNQAQLETVQVVQSSTSSLMTIMDDLLDYTKLENGRLQLQHTEFEPRAVVQGCIAAMRKDVEQKRLAVVEDCPSDLDGLKVLGDPSRLRQILLNFLTNAIKFTHEGSITLKVSRVAATAAAKTDTATRAKGSTGSRNHVANGVSAKQQALPKQCLRFEVIDTGIGIHPNHQHLLFGKYQQGNASIARNFGGTGLGLAICKGMTEAMGGCVGLMSELDRGTTVFCEIPFDLVDTTSKKRLSNKRRLSSIVRPPDEQAKLRILVAEDNRVNQKLVKAMLKRMGHTAVLADDGQIAVDHVRNTAGRDPPFDVVLMDVQMPVMDGIEATKQIRLLDNQLPIIGLTASYIESDLEYYKSVGMSTCVGKPARLGELKSIIETVHKESVGDMEDIVVEVRARKMKCDTIMEEKEIN